MAATPSFPAAIVPASLLILVLLFQSPPAATSLSAYEALQEFNFPEGIHCKGVTGYELDWDTGKFRTFLNGSCSSPRGLIPAQVQSTISGYVSQNRLTALLILPHIK